METVPPLTLAFLRLLLGSIVLIAIAMYSGVSLPQTRNHWLTAGFVGIVGNALPFTLIHWGEQTIDSGLAALFMGVMPIWVVVLAHFLTGERITTVRALGVVIAFIGLTVLVGGDVLKQLGDDVLAQLAVIAAAICYALSTIYVRMRQPLPMKPVAAGAVLIGAIVMLPITLAFESPDFASFSSRSIMAIVLLGVLQTGLAALIYFHLIARVGATLFSQINYIIPLLGVAWGVTLLGERPGIQEAVAAVCILVGLVLVNRQPKAAHGAN